LEYAILVFGTRRVVGQDLNAAGVAEVAEGITLVDGAFVIVVVAVIIVVAPQKDRVARAVEALAGFALTRRAVGDVIKLADGSLI
jgi:hypothetical protein